MSATLREQLLSISDWCELYRPVMSEKHQHEVYAYALTEQAAVAMRNQDLYERAASEHGSWSMNWFLRECMGVEPRISYSPSEMNNDIMDYAKANQSISDYFDIGVITDPRGLRDDIDDGEYEFEGLQLFSDLLMQALDLKYPV